MKDFGWICEICLRRFSILRKAHFLHFDTPSNEGMMGAMGIMKRLGLGAMGSLGALIIILNS